MLGVLRSRLAELGRQAADFGLGAVELPGDPLELPPQHTRGVAAAADLGGELLGLGAERPEIGLRQRQLRAQRAGVGSDRDRKIISHHSFLKCAPAPGHKLTARQRQAESRGGRAAPLRSTSRHSATGGSARSMSSCWAARQQTATSHTGRALRHAVAGVQTPLGQTDPPLQFRGIARVGPLRLRARSGCDAIPPSPSHCFPSRHALARHLARHLDPEGEASANLRPPFVGQLREVFHPGKAEFVVRPIIPVARPQPEPQNSHLPSQLVMLLLTVALP